MVETRLRSEQGVALVTVLALTLVVLALGAGMSISNRGATRTDSSFKNQQRTFESAVAGLEHARETLRQCMYAAATAATQNPAAACFSYTNRLTAAAGADGNLANSLTLAGFNVVNGIPTVDDVPVLADQVLGGATYRVYLTNDPWQGVTNKTDEVLSGTPTNGHRTITLTSFARAENQAGFSAVQAMYRPGPAFTLPRLPALVTLPGPDIDIDMPTSNTVTDGDEGDPPCFAAFAATTNAARDKIRLDIQPSKRDNYRTCNPTGAGTRNANTVPGSIENFINTTSGPNPYAPGETNVPELAAPGNASLIAGQPLPGCSGNERDFISAQCMTSLRQAIENLPNATRFTVGNTPANNSTVMGSPTSPKIVVIDGDYNLNPPGTSSFGGILVVKGTFTMTGNGGYTGVILVIGEGRADRSGGGNGELCGGLLVVDVDNDGDDPDDSWISGPGLVGRPFYNHNGGGNSLTGSCRNATTGGFSDFQLPLTRISFTQLR